MSTRFQTLTTTIPASLSPDARIIAEDETHAVIALRIRKSTIRRNLAFVAALADLAPPLKRRRPRGRPRH